MDNSVSINANLIYDQTTGMLMKIYCFFPFVLIISMLVIPTHGYGLSGSYQNLSGDMVSIDNYNGKILLVESIQTTCPACKDGNHRSRIQTLYGEYSDQVSFLVITIRDDDTIELMQNFVSDWGISWSAGLDLNNVLQTQLGIRATPTVVLLDGTGVIRNTWEGNDYQLNDYRVVINQFVENPITIPTSTTNGGSGGGSGSDTSIIGDIFGNPIFQIALVAILVLMIYFRSTKGS